MKFEYKAIDKSNGSQRGVIEAGSRDEAIGLLRARALKPLLVHEKKPSRVMPIVILVSVMVVLVTAAIIVLF